VSKISAPDHDTISELESSLFPIEFLTTLRGLIGVHHSIYPRIPPQGIYFESLVEEAFLRTKRPFSIVKGTARNAATHDLLVDDQRLSIKTETGKNTKVRTITITKLCTTEKEPWEPDILVGRALAHLGRYDVVLMLRALWKLPVIRYQVLLIDVGWLRRMEFAAFAIVGKRAGRKSFGADIVDAAGDPLFRVHFDASDGKCSVRKLRVSDCEMLSEWDIRVPD
jgi:hypothetical protein